MYDIIIIGAGVAGLTSAIYAGSRGKKTLLIDKASPGGVLGGVSTVTHYPGVIKNETGKTIISRMLDQVKDYNIDIVSEKVLSVDLNGEVKKIKTNNTSYSGKNIIIANGTSPNKLQANIEHFSGEIYYSAIGNISDYANKEIYVIGGSDGAVKEALFLADIGKVLL